jgi:hypothetical protein
MLLRFVLALCGLWGDGDIVPLRLFLEDWGRSDSAPRDLRLFFRAERGGGDATLERELGRGDMEEMSGSFGIVGMGERVRFMLEGEAEVSLRGGSWGGLLGEEGEGGFWDSGEGEGGGSGETL